MSQEKLTIDNIYEHTDLRVARWDSYDFCHYPSSPITEEVKLVVAREVRDRNYMVDGNFHINSLSGCPILNNGTCARFSGSEWNELMAVAYNITDEDEKVKFFSEQLIQKNRLREPVNSLDEDIVQKCTGKEYTIKIAKECVLNDFTEYHFAPVNDSFLDLRINDKLTLVDSLNNQQVSFVVKYYAIYETIEDFIKDLTYGDCLEAVPYQMGYGQLDFDRLEKKLKEVFIKKVYLEKYNHYIYLELARME